MSVEKNVNGNSDNILSEMGRFGPYQKMACLLLSLIGIVVEQSSMNYMITANALEYR